jgi:hypothetical protein
MEKGNRYLVRDAGQEGCVETPSRSHETRATQRRRALRWLLAGALVLLLAARVAAAFTANVNWDEFALLHLADASHVSGVLQTGGRPGLAVLAVWIAQLAPAARGRWRDAALGVALLALLPAFLESSLQVRTDQIGLAGGAWGGAALLASRQRPALALAAGALFATGFLHANSDRVATGCACCSARPASRSSSWPSGPGPTAPSTCRRPRRRANRSAQPP